MARWAPERDTTKSIEAYQTWMQTCLALDGALFAPNHALWTKERFDELDARFVRAPDGGTGSFHEKLRGQLRDATPEAAQLMAEVFWTYAAYPTNTSPEKKRSQIVDIWSWSGETLSADHSMLSDEVLAGVGSGGTGYSVRRWKELVYVISVLRAFKALARRQREQALSDPWRFAQWVGGVDSSTSAQFRHVIKFYCFPDTFERIAATVDKDRILQEFGEASKAELARWDDVQKDQRLLDLRRRLEIDRGDAPFDFFLPDIEERWRPSSKSYLLTWSPKNWAFDELSDYRAKTAAGELVTRRWASGTRQPKVGDTVYLMRLAVEPRGVIAKGNVVREAYDAPHYLQSKAEAGETISYIDVDFDSVRDPERDPIVPVSVLETRAPAQPWTPQSSGISISASASAELTRLWRALPPVELNGASRAASPQTAKSKGAPLNVIYYGPPGTGKTRELMQLRSNYETSASTISADEWLATNIAGLSWWEAVFLALADTQVPMSVDQILAHPYFSARARGTANNSLRGTCWNALQYHTSPDSVNVRVNWEKRYEPYVFDKDDQSRWTLVGDWRDSCSELLGKLEDIKRGPGAATTVRRWEFVTFHQSYAYEEFVEGIRPQVVAGAISYDVAPGLFKRLCDRARRDPNHRYALFIDEINRANIAKVFGELITLIEPDKRAVYDDAGLLKEGLEATLPYSGERFGVPANLDLFGAMNTSDRSISLLDAALRRRFEFKELLPMSGVISGEDGNGSISVTDGDPINLRKLLDALNSRIATLLHRDQMIGHSYFTKVNSFDKLRLTLRNEIVPLLQEYFHEDWRRIRQVFADEDAERDAQIVREVEDNPIWVSGDDDDAQPMFEIAAAHEMSPDAIRKIYEPQA